MSYCRWSDDSGLYIFHGSGEGLVCMHIDMPDFTTRSRAAMIAHMDEHKAEGTLVSVDAYERLEREIREEGDEVKD